MTTTVGILAYGSLIDDPGTEIGKATVRVIQGVQTPFGIEYARASGSRGGAPTLVPLDNGGGRVEACLLVVDASEADAASMLWRRETRQVGSGRQYARPENPGPNSVLVERIEDFAGTDIVLYTNIAATIEPLTAWKLAELAIGSVAGAPRDKDGISYLMAAKSNGIETPLSAAYEAEVLKLTEADSLAQALENAKKGSL